MDLNRPLIDQIMSHMDLIKYHMDIKMVSYGPKKPLMDLIRSYMDLNRPLMDLIMSHMDLKNH